MKCFSSGAIFWIVLVDLLSFLISSGTYGQRVANHSFDEMQRFPVSAVQQDVAILADSLRTIHPALYRFISAKRMDSNLNALQRKIDRPLALTAAYNLIAPFVALIGDSHTSVEVPEAYHRYLVTQSQLLPFDVRIINGRIFVASNNSEDSTILPGSRILAIDDRPAESILEKMMRCFSSDARNQTFKVRRAEQRFAFHYQIVFGYSDSFKIRYVKEGGKPQVTTVAALPFSVIKVNREKNRQQYPLLKPLFPQAPLLDLSIDEAGHTAVLTFKTFDKDVLKEAGLPFELFADSAFAAIRRANVTDVIIDIRGNEGGESSYASYLYSCLTDKPFKFLQCMEAAPVTCQRDREAGVKYTHIDGSGIFRTADSSKADDRARFFGMDLQQPAVRQFAGKVYVLINGLTSSSASQFASLVRLYGRGILVGEEAPGPAHGGSGREYARFNLPNTGLPVTISKYRLYLSRVKDDNGPDVSLEPDYTPIPDMKQLLAGRDKDMETVLRIIAEQSIKR